MATLKTNYKDDILNTNKNTKRKYNMLQNSDGTVSFEDVTDYTQIGDVFGSKDVNEMTTAINQINSDLGNLEIINGTVFSKILEKSAITNIGKITLQPGLYMLIGCSQVDIDVDGTYMLYCCNENGSQLNETVVRNIKMEGGGGGGFATPFVSTASTTIELFIINTDCDYIVKNKYTYLRAIKIR